MASTIQGMLITVRFAESHTIMIALSGIAPLLFLEYFWYSLASPKVMDGDGARAVVECLDVCPLDDVVCAQICSRAAAVGARGRGMPFYVPFRQAPLEDWSTLFTGSPATSNWQAPNSPNASFASWVNVWRPDYNSEPLLSAVVDVDSAVQCHRACEAQSAHFAEWGLEPLSGVYAGVVERALGPRLYLPATDWEVNPLMMGSFRATHIPIKGQPVAFQEAPPDEYAADLRG